MKYEFPPLLLLPNETLNITAEVEGKQMDNLEKTSDPIDDGDLLKYENGSVQKFEYDFGRLWIFLENWRYKWIATLHWHICF